MTPSSDDTLIEAGPPSPSLTTTTTAATSTAATASPSLPLSASGRRRAIAAIVLYIFAGITVVFIDKALLSSPGYSLPAPVFVAALQAAISAGFCAVLGQLADMYRSSTGGGTPTGCLASVVTRIPSFTLDPGLLRTTYPLSLVFSLMIAFNNLTLSMIAVSEFNLARSLTILWTVALSYWVLGERLSSGQGLAVFMLLCGYIVGTDGEVHPSIKGLVFGLCSSLCIAANSVGTKIMQAVPGIDGDNLRLTTYVTFSAAPTLLLMSLATGEAATILANLDVLLFMPQFWVLTLCAGIGSFFIGFAVMMVILTSSPTTYTIVATAKATVQTLAGFALYKTPTTPQNILGIIMVLLASLIFALSPSPPPSQDEARRRQ